MNWTFLDLAWLDICYRSSRESPLASTEFYYFKIGFNGLEILLLNDPKSNVTVVGATRSFLGLFWALIYFFLSISSSNSAIFLLASLNAS